MQVPFTRDVVVELIKNKFPRTNEVQYCSYICPDGEMLSSTMVKEHYDVAKRLVLEEIVATPIDGFTILGEAGFIRYSSVGYIELPYKNLTEEQYDTITRVLESFARFRNVIDIQSQANPRIYVQYSLDNIKNIIDKIKKFYKTKKLGV